VVAVATGRVMTRNVHLVGQRLKEIELAEGLDGRRMAEALRITDVNWSRYKSGTRELPIPVAGERRPSLRRHAFLPVAPTLTERTKLMATTVTAGPETRVKR
jgi:hypothetical protein